VGYLERKKRDRMRAGTDTLNAHLDYSATFSRKDRIVFSLLTVASASFTCFTYAHSGHYWTKILISAILGFCVVTVYRLFSTAVRFTDRWIVVEVKWCFKYSEAYEAVSAIKVHASNLRIEFADGRTLNIPSSLGDLTRIASILEKRVNILPNQAGVPPAPPGRQ
jgi:hypothetical protein